MERGLLCRGGGGGRLGGCGESLSGLYDANVHLESSGQGFTPRISKANVILGIFLVEPVFQGRSFGQSQTRSWIPPRTELLRL